MRTTRLGKWALGAALLAGVASWNGQAAAYPVLQLDIGGGFYDPTPGVESIIGTSDPFTLYAILTPHQNATTSQINALLATTYYISVALTPKVGPPGGALGSFIFNGTTVNATSDMYYGVPPLESNLAHDGGDLGQHGIFETYFREFSFNFSSLNTTARYNTADNPGGPSAGTGAYYAAFNVDSRLLGAGYDLHFDLYNTRARNGGDIDVNDFAPFSHDAECCVQRVPEPSTLLLLGAGLAGLGAWRRWKA